MILHRRQFLVGATLSSFVALSGCDSKQSADAPKATAGGKDKVTLQLNWFPEAEHGGFYAAALHGIYDKYNLEVEILPGGKSSVVPQELTLGRIQFGVGNADELLIARQEGLDVVALMAPLQISPRCILVRQDSGIDSLSKLGGLTLQLGTGQPFIDFLKSKGYLENVKIVPYQGTVGALIADKQVGQQAYVFSEPLIAEQQNVPVRSLMVSDAGFNPYTSLLLATTKYVDGNSDITKRMVQASIEGWQKYLQEPETTNAHILKLNSEGLTKEALVYGVEKMKPLCIPEGTTVEQVGTMTEQRWKELADEMARLKLIDSAKVPYQSCYRAEFLPPAK